MKKTILAFFLASGFFVSVNADDLSNPAVFSTNAGYAAFAGYANISADGTNALAQLATATGRVAALEAVDVTTTGRVASLEASRVTLTGQVAVLQAVDIATTSRVARLESFTNSAVAGGTAYQPNATNFLTEGYWDIVNTTQLVFMASGTTNVLDYDISSP